MDGGLHPAFAVWGGDAVCVEGLGDVEDASAAKCHGEDASDDSVAGWVKFEDGPFLGAVLDVDLAVAIGGHWCDPESAGCGLPHAPDNLLRQIFRVVFVHALDDALQQPAGGVVLGLLGDGHHADALAPQLGLEGDGVLALAGEPTEFPDQDDVERGEGAAALVDHLAELWAVCDTPALGLIDVLADDGEVVLLRVFAEGAKLRGDGEVDVLSFAGDACIDSCGGWVLSFGHWRDSFCVRVPASGCME